MSPPHLFPILHWVLFFVFLGFWHLMWIPISYFMSQFGIVPGFLKIRSQLCLSGMKSPEGMLQFSQCVIQEVCGVACVILVRLTLIIWLRWCLSSFSTDFSFCKWILPAKITTVEFVWWWFCIVFIVPTILFGILL